MRHRGDKNRRTSLATLPKYPYRRPHWLDETNYSPGPRVAYDFAVWICLASTNQPWRTDRDHQSSVNSRFSYLWLFLIHVDALRSRTTLRNFIDEAKRSC